MPGLKRGIAGATLIAILTACGSTTADLSQANKDAVKAQIEKYRQAGLAAVTGRPRAMGRQTPAGHSPRSRWASSSGRK